MGDQTYPKNIRTKFKNLENPYPRVCTYTLYVYVCLFVCVWGGGGGVYLLIYYKLHLSVNFMIFISIFTYSQKNLLTKFTIILFFHVSLSKMFAMRKTGGILAKTTVIKISIGLLII